MTRKKGRIRIKRIGADQFLSDPLDPGSHPRFSWGYRDSKNVPHLLKLHPQTRAQKCPGTDIHAVAKCGALVAPFAEIPTERVPGVQVERGRFEQVELHPAQNALLKPEEAVVAVHPIREEVRFVQVFVAREQVEIVLQTVVQIRADVRQR